MEPKQLAKRLGVVLNDLAHLSGSVCVMKALDVGQYPEHYEELSTQAALSAEKIACKLRSLVYATTRMPKQEYLVRAGEAHGIDISETDGVLQITLPCLLPKKRSRRGSLFLSEPLFAVLESYTAHRKAPRFRECVVCFCHVYEKDLFPGRIPDHDNYLQKQILDVVTTFLLTDDGGQFCDLYNTAEAGNQGHTHIFVMARELFPTWLAEREKRRKSI